MMTERQADPTKHDDVATLKRASARRIDARALLGEAREIVIMHREQDYRLRVTSNGKLILTK